MTRHSRRRFLSTTLGTTAAALAAGPLCRSLLADDATRRSKMSFGLVTYLWGRDWDLPTLITNCEKTNVLGVELRTTHEHGVELSLNAGQRADVKKRFADSRIEFVSIGSNERFDSPDAGHLNKSIETTKAFLKLSADVGGSGVKVKPNDFQKNVPREKTIEQIGQSLNLLGAFAKDMGQEVRLEVHGQCAELPTIKAIMDVATHENVGVCWNCNGQDLQGEGLVQNFNLVKDRFGATAHVRELDESGYPYQQLVGLLVEMDYDGWVLLEARGNPADRVAALAGQRELFDQMVAKALEG